MDEQYKIHISSKHRLFDLHLKETVQYRYLIFLFVKKDFLTRYKQTILGPCWAVIQPLLSTTVFTIVFGNLARLTKADIQGDFIIPGFLFYMCGNNIWSYFSSTLKAVSGTFLNNRGTMGKVYYPRLVVPIATAFSKLIPFGIQMGVFAVIWIFYIVKGGTSIQITFGLLLLPLLTLQMMLLAVGFGIIISSATTKYRDLAMLVDFGLELWRYGCPIAYGLLLLPEKYLGAYMLNPITPVITTFRYALFGFGYFNAVYYFLSWFVSIVVFLIGLIIFSKIERSFMDTI